MRFLKVSLLVGLLTGLTSGMALDASICLKDDTINVVFQNGINTTEEGARVNLKSLRSLMGSTSNRRPLDYKFNYNPTNQLLNDMWEVFKQKTNEVGGLYAPATSFWISMSYFLGDTDTPPPDQYQPKVPGLLDAWRHVIDQQLYDLRRLSATTLYQDPVVMTLATNLAGILGEGRSVVLVPHSQGNLYASAVYRDLAESHNTAIQLDQLRILGVGVPADGIPGTSDYVTSNTDNVVNGLRPLFPVLPANDFSVPEWNDDRYFGLIPAGHSFSAIYTNPRYDISNRLYDKFTALTRTLSTPFERLGNGPLTVTLTWDQPGDVDLHVKQSDGSHIFYGDTSNPIGYLDRDDTVGTGPEHYYLSCDALVSELNSKGEAHFTIGLNYFRGEGSRSATLVVNALNQQLIAPAFVLNTARGADGDQTPYGVFTVNFKAQGDKATVDVQSTSTW